MAGRIVILGGGPNLAMATARRFGRESWHVLLGARDGQRLAEQRETLASEGIRADIAIVDATDSLACGDFVEAIEREHGPIDLFNYNAAVIRQARLLDLAPEAVAPDLMTDVGGAVFALQAMLPRMTARGSGCVILSGGGLALDPWPDYLTLSIGKAGLRALGAAVAKDPAFADIHIVHAILHTAIDSDAGARIADLYWALAQEDKASWRSEVTFPPTPGGPVT
jgi:NADP-dependent 3-hydroxy acid dehydrogenase YdfG